MNKTSHSSAAHVASESPSAALAAISPGRADTAAALERVTPRALALPPEAVLRINTGIAAALLRARRALPAIVALRQQMARLVDFDVARLDAFDDTTNALYELDVRRQAASDAESLPKLTDECIALRNRAFIDAEPLVHRGFIDPAEIEAIKDGQGRDDLARDLTRYANIFESVKKNPAAVTAVTDEEIAHMRDRAAALRAAIETPSDATPAQREAQELRQRVYSLFVTDYDQLRRAVTYLRWDHGDADAIAPTLFFKRRSSAAKPEEKDSEPSEEDRKPEPEPVPAPEPAHDTDPSRPVPQDDPYGRR